MGGERGVAFTTFHLVVISLWCQFNERLKLKRLKEINSNMFDIIFLNSDT